MNTTKLLIFKSTFLLILLGMFLVGCGLVDQNTARIMVYNNTGEDVKLVAGDYATVSTKPHGLLLVNIPSNGQSTVFKPTTDHSVNLWYLNTAENHHTIFIDSEGSPKDFTFQKDVEYTLEINTDTYTLTTDSEVFTADINFSRSFPPIFRNPVVEADEDSRYARNVNPVTATIIREDSSRYSYFRVYATFQFDWQPDDPVYLGFPKARIYLDRPDGTSLYNTTQDSGDGFRFINMPYTSFYESSSGENNYHNNALFPGDRGYLEWYDGFDKTDTTHPLYNISPSDIGRVRVDLIASEYTILDHVKLTTSNGGLGVQNPVFQSEKLEFEIKNYSTDIWWQFDSWNSVYFLDGEGRILGHDKIKANPGSSLLVEPQMVNSLYGDYSPNTSDLVKSAIYLLDYDEGIPLSQSMNPGRTILDSDSGGIIRTIHDTADSYRRESILEAKEMEEAFGN